jgi:hypothetical protein
VIEVIHSKRDRPLLVGDIKLGKNAVRNNGRFIFTSGRITSMIIGALLLLSSLLMYLSYTYMGFIPPIVKSITGLYSLILLGSISSFFIILWSIKHFPRNLLTKPIRNNINTYKEWSK